MAGVPGKGGRAGRSGRPQSEPGVTLVPYAVSVTPADKAELMKRGTAWVRGVLSEALED